MTMRIKLCLSLILVAVIAMAQNNKKEFSLHDLIPGGETFYQNQPQNMYLTWWGDECIETTPEVCYIVNKTTGKKQTLVQLSDINEWMKASSLCASCKPIRSAHYIQFPYANKSIVRFYASSNDGKSMRYVEADFKKKCIVQSQELPTTATAIDRAPASGNIAFVSNKNLYVSTPDKGSIAVSTDGSDDLVYGQSVHRNEFGISKGTFWSPDGELLAFYRMDQSMVPSYPQVDINSRIASTFTCKYPMAGEASHKVTIGVFCPKTGITTWLKAGDPTDRYFTNIAWAPNNKTIFVIELNRDQNHAQLVSYNAETGDREGVLYEETHPKYVEPQHPIVFLPWNENQFIYQSQRDGFNHLYVMDLSHATHNIVEFRSGGKAIENIKTRQLTMGKWVVKELIGFTADNKSVNICSNELHPLNSNIYNVNIKTGKRRMLDNGRGVHYASLSPDGKFILDNWSEPTTGRNIAMIEVKNGKQKELLNAPHPWRTNFNMPEITSGSIQAADDSTQLYYRLIKPTDFDPNKKYPTVIYVYGGPHAHNIENSRNYSARGWELYMAQKGYVVFVLDNRGSEYRGIEFENVTFRHLGVEEMKDQIKGVEFLKTLSYVDANRLGVYGWSFGGFMTTNLMTTYPDVFKVGVAGGPVIDWQYYEIMYGERYMDTPQSNPEGYKGSNLREKAKNLKGKLQVIFGYNDPVCVPQHALSFIKACVDAGTQPDMFTYPGHEHGVVGVDAVHLNERITQYFEDYLK